MDTFLSQRYPTVEQTLVNNASSLYQQKRLLLAEFRNLMGSIGCILIAIAYLRDVTFLPFLFRLLTQLSLSVPSKPLSLFANLPLSEREKSEQRMFLFTAVFFSSFASVILHLIYGPYRSSRMGDHQLHGGFTVQFIGERLPFGLWELLLYDVLIFCCQYIYFCIMWATDDLVILQNRAADITSDEAAVENDLLSDGFDGNVFLLTIHLWQTLRQISVHRNSEDENVRPPANVTASIFRRNLV